MNIQPLFDKVIVKRDFDRKATESGLMLPSGMKDKPKTGVIVSCGEGLFVKEGDKIMFGEYSGATFKHEGEDFLIMRESDIFAILK